MMGFFFEGLESFIRQPFHLYHTIGNQLLIVLTRPSSPFCLFCLFLDLSLIVTRLHF